MNNEDKNNAKREKMLDMLDSVERERLRKQQEARREAAKARRQIASQSGHNQRFKNEQQGRLDKSKGEQG